MRYAAPLACCAAERLHILAPMNAKWPLTLLQCCRQFHTQKHSNSNHKMVETASHWLMVAAHVSGSVGTIVACSFVPLPASGSNDAYNSPIVERLPSQVACECFATHQGKPRAYSANTGELTGS